MRLRGDSICRGMLQRRDEASPKAEDARWRFVYIIPTPNQKVRSQGSGKPRICVCRVGEESQLGATNQGDQPLGRFSLLATEDDGNSNPAFEEKPSVGLGTVNLGGERHTTGARRSQGERAPVRRLDRHFSHAGKSAKVGAVAGGHQRCNRLSQVLTWQKNPQEARVRLGLHVGDGLVALAGVGGRTICVLWSIIRSS